MPMFDYRKTAEIISATDFEFLVRAYCQRQATRVQAELQSSKDVRIEFSITVDQGGTATRAYWEVNLEWGSNSTKGEVLDGCADELVRRERWQRAATLRQIEG